jgi:hypothetical protein
MNLESAKALRVGDRVRILEAVLVTNQDDEEIELPVGTIGAVSEVRHLDNKQGWQVCVDFENGGYAYYDEADETLFPLETA